MLLNIVLEERNMADLNEVLIYWKSKGEVYNANFASAVSEKSERALVVSGLFS